MTIPSFSTRPALSARFVQQTFIEVVVDGHPYRLSVHEAEVLREQITKALYVEANTRGVGASR